ncbi:hypothetical protein [Halovivax sp.]|uniref:DUF7511 domain-containing protein n=1 Tax=Halovivax sp. TaxID=1935978 RepID=UPI0025C5FE50|nr:hypothetical protein [Halovivax sp.]
MTAAPDTTKTDRSPDDVLFEHVVVENGDLPDECAFVPPEDAPESEATAWIIASGEGFVDRASMR